MKERRRKIKLYKKLALITGIVSIIFIGALLFLTKDSIELSVKDGETITLEYGIDEVPAVTGLYWESFFDKEGDIVPVTSQGDVDTTSLGTYSVTYTASYEQQSVSATQTIIIQDTTAPEITLTGGETDYYSPGYSYIESGYTAIDNYDGDITDRVVTTQTDNSITYTVSDSLGNSTTVTRKIECKDVVPPTITLNGEEHIELAYGDAFSDAGAMAIDDVDGNLTSSMTVSGSVDSTVYGEQYITYTVTDSAGNVSERQRIIVVKESTPPELSLSGDERIFIKLGETYTDPGYSATDNADGDITAKVAVDGTVDTEKIGAYYLTYTATDSSHNTTTQTRSVFVYAPLENSDIEPNGKVVYLSFDDGPGPYTEQLLDILDKYNVKVTFFVTNQYSDYQYLIGEAHRRGHTIAMHTYSHVFSNLYANESAYYEDLNKIQSICEEQTGVSPTIVRFPGGTSNVVSKNYCNGIMSALIQSLPANGYQYCDWNIDSMDAGGAKTAEEVTQNVLSAIPDFKNSFVLQHDTKEFSVEAVEEIIRWGLENGYTFMPMNAKTPMFHHPVNN